MDCHVYPCVAFLVGELDPRLRERIAAEFPDAMVMQGTMGIGGRSQATAQVAFLNQPVPFDSFERRFVLRLMMAAGHRAQSGEFDRMAEQAVEGEAAP